LLIAIAAAIELAADRIGPRPSVTRDAMSNPCHS
jgi:hypothetical protein